MIRPQNKGEGKSREIRGGTMTILFFGNIVYIFSRIDPADAEQNASRFMCVENALASAQEIAIVKCNHRVQSFAAGSSQLLAINC